MKGFLHAALTALERYNRIAIATVVRASGSTPRAAGAKMLIFPDGTAQFTIGGGLFESLVIKDALEVLQSGKPLTRTYAFTLDGQHAIGAVCGGSVEVLIEAMHNTPQLWIIGGGHIGQALMRAAAPLHFTISLFEDRAGYARTPHDLPHVRAHHVAADYHDMPEPGDDTFVCIVTKGYITDEAALRRVIRSRAHYIGFLGSRRKIHTVFENMKRDGFEGKLFERIYAPIGESIHADAPEEIAISILAQIIRVKNQVFTVES
ncbi:MAG TPA: XdhC family protein [bacterium]|nr:XdhC family protein [bacterium]